jgi:GNAT superfamily N-acetyltransferase
VARWLEARGEKLWDSNEISEADVRGHAEQRELVLGFENGRPVACLYLQAEDPLYWPEARAGEALYVHRLAVCRAQAGRGWSRRLLDWSADETRRRGRALLRLDTELRPKLMALYEGAGFVRFDDTLFGAGTHRVVRYERVV